MSQGIWNPRDYLNVRDQKRVLFSWQEGTATREVYMPFCLIEPVGNDDYVRAITLFDGERQYVRYRRWGYVRAEVRPEWRIVFPFVSIDDWRLCQYLFDTQASFYIKGVNLWGSPIKERLRRYSSTIYEGTWGWWKAGSVKVYLNGSEVTSGFTLHLNVGKVQFSSVQFPEDLIEASYEREPLVKMVRLEPRLAYGSARNPRFDLTITVIETIPSTEVP